ncbi:hypothetical protein [Shimazuella alba]|uniref:Uncharacterized protein n=1 Tax=Shimazuella alba TaxID=2690964 RepID=A0A6I4W005_9BACL|nr:hypothetical protein [Shimazuella alba]MXQ55296.1 hypothetical protein [Shimazuella alba]
MLGKLGFVVRLLVLPLIASNTYSGFLFYCSLMYFFGGYAKNTAFTQIPDIGQIALGRTVAGSA